MMEITHVVVLTVEGAHAALCSWRNAPVPTRGMRVLYHDEHSSQCYEVTRVGLLLDHSMPKPGSDLKVIPNYRVYLREVRALVKEWV